MGAWHAGGGLVGRGPVDEGAQALDQALVAAALRHLLGSVWVHQLAGQHHAAVSVERLREGVHVDADQGAVGTTWLAGGD